MEVVCTWMEAWISNLHSTIVGNIMCVREPPT